jgi:hypothetical protein
VNQYGPAALTAVVEDPDADGYGDASRSSHLRHEQSETEVTLISESERPTGPWFAKRDPKHSPGAFDFGVSTAAAEA